MPAHASWPQRCCITPAPSARSALAAVLAGAALLLAGCQTQQQQLNQQESPPGLCYQQLSGPPTSLSIEQLRLERRGGQLVGTYNWMPWQKDRRLGRLAGEENPAGTARLIYRFQQEGQQAEASLTVVFDASQARITWDRTDPAAQPMPAVRLPRSSCANLKPVPKL